jgi:hypothetical protein
MIEEGANYLDGLNDNLYSKSPSLQHRVLQPRCKDGSESASSVSFHSLCASRSH